MSSSVHHRSRRVIYVLVIAVHDYRLALDISTLLYQQPCTFFSLVGDGSVVEDVTTSHFLTQKARLFEC